MAGEPNARMDGAWQVVKTNPATNVTTLYSTFDTQEEAILCQQAAEKEHRQREADQLSLFQEGKVNSPNISDPGWTYTVQAAPEIVAEPVDEVGVGIREPKPPILVQVDDDRTQAIKDNTDALVALKASIDALVAKQ